ncbi:YncE family protein [Roseomonas frigidaquae]|uniref:YncE family protein n=1 Tax=Falsiroseomonas frigidaquae TaxID=487318 RepID=A0ABX1ER96_9PROT|nr:YncE family protein [Falsiroseomonas frigidaquae]NKE43166.1 YncE family protein [Falsiroseomonas frigidaquae]
MARDPSRPPAGHPAPSRRHLLALMGTGLAASVLRPRLALAAPAVEKTVQPGAGLYEIVVSSTTGLVHVASVGKRGENAAKILGLDPRTLETKSSIELGAEAAFGMGVNDRRGLLLGTATRSGALLVIDARSGTVRARIAEGERAHVRQVIADEANDRAFVTVFGGRGRPSAIWVADTATNAMATVITEGLDGGIIGAAYDPAGDRLFATALQSNEIVEVSLARKAGIRRFASGGEGPINIVHDATSGRLFCANQKTGTLTVLNAASGELVKAIETGAGALGVTLSADGALAYVANRQAGTVSVVDTRGLVVVANLATGTHPNTVAVDRRTGLAYVSNKARSAPRGQPPVEDPNGDTVSLIRI